LLADVRPIALGSARFLVRAPWGVMRGFVRRLAEIEATEMGQRAREAAVEDATRDLLARVIVGWEGPCDEQGRPLPWHADRLDELEPAAVAELVRRLAEPPEELGTGKGPSG